MDETNQLTDGKSIPERVELVAMNFALRYMKSNDTVTKNCIVGGWTNPFDKIWVQMVIFPFLGVKTTKYSKHPEKVQG